MNVYIGSIVALTLISVLVYLTRCHLEKFWPRKDTIQADIIKLVFASAGAVSVGQLVFFLVTESEKTLENEISLAIFVAAVVMVIQVVSAFIDVLFYRVKTQVQSTSPLEGDRSSTNIVVD